MFSNQNEKNNLELLQAMRYFYSKAKKIKATVLVVSICLPLLYMGYRYVKNIESIKLEYDAVVISIGLLWILIMYFLESYADTFVVNGAKTQEKFDINIFNLPKNDVLILNNIDEEKIYDAQQSFKGDTASLQNWYGTKRRGPHYLKVLIAQRMNIIWGNELKSKYKKLIEFLKWAIILLAVSMALYLNMNFQDSLTFIIFPLIPLFYLSMKTSKALDRQMIQNKNIDTKILHDCENFANINAEQRCRLYQDYIYSENRIRTVLISDWFYKIFKNNTNKKISDTNERLLIKYGHL